MQINLLSKWILKGCDRTLNRFKIGGSVAMLALAFGLVTWPAFGGSNLVTNPGFESSFDSWNTSGTTAIVTTSHAGTYAFQSTTNGKVTQIITGIDATHSYTLSGWATTTSSSQRGYVRAVFLNSSGTQLGTSSVLQYTASSYAQLTTTFTPTSGTTQIRVEAWKTAGTGCFDDISLVDNNTSSSCSAVPSVPTGLASSNVTSSGCTLSWTASTVGSGCSLTGYVVYQNGTQVATPTTNSVNISGLSASTTYSFTVAAMDSFGTSAASSALSVTTSASSSCTAAPSVPTGLASSNITSSGCTLSWTASTVGSGCTLTGYKVYQNGTQVAAPTTNSVNIAGLSASTTYSFTVASVDSYGTSAVSGALSVTTSVATSGHLSNHVFIDCDQYFLSDATVAAHISDVATYKFDKQFIRIAGFTTNGGGAITTDDTDALPSVANWIRISRLNQPNIKLLGVINSDWNIENTTSTTARNTVASLCNTWCNTGILLNGVYYKLDGIVCDFEPTASSSRSGLLAMLTAIKSAIGSDKLLAICAPMDDTTSSYQWTQDYTRQIAEVVDIIAPMIYDTAMTNSSTYTAYVKKLTQWFADGAALASHACVVEVIMPSYWPSSVHTQSIESIANSSTGVKQAIAADANANAKCSAGAGVFFGDTFFGWQTVSGDTHDYIVDRADWLNDWTNSN